MPFRRPILIVMFAGLLALSGCKKQKPNVPPPQATAPTVTTPATEPATPTTEPAQPAATEPAQPEANPSTNTPPPKAKPAKPRPSRPRASTNKKPSEKPATQTPATPAKPSPQIAKNTPPAQPANEPPPIVPSLPHDQALHDRLTTEQLIVSSEQVVNASTKRSLSSAQEDMVSQIRVYIQQSRSATGDGDLVRARTLALKAHLLSDELAK